METVIHTGDSAEYMPDSGVSAQDLRTAMGTFLTGVTIVTVRGANAEPYGLTVSSFNSVSLDPPLILWSLDNRHEKAQLFREARRLYSQYHANRI
jgi:flavin reductase (DIM6/NTAB) family NADH-FMN oxidoreductase RutF